MSKQEKFTLSINKLLASRFGLSHPTRNLYEVGLEGMSLMEMIGIELEVVGN